MILMYVCRFVKGLKLLDKDFRQAMKSANNAHEKPVISEENLKLILGNVGSILTLNSGLLDELEIRMSTWWVGLPHVYVVLSVLSPLQGQQANDRRYFS